MVDTPVATEPEPEAEAYVPDAPDMVEVEAPTELDGARTAELPVLEVPQLEMPVLQVPVLESPPMPEPEPEPEPEPVVAEAVPMMAPLSLQPLTQLASQMPTIAPPPEPEPQPEPLALEPEPEPEPASDPLMSRLAPLPANAAMTAAEAASIFVPTTDDIPGLDDLPELSSVAYLPSVATEALSTPSLPTMPAMPTMPSMPERPAPTPAPSFGFDSSEQTAAVEMAEAAGLPKLASAPYDVDAMQMNPALDAARVAAGQPHNLAAVEIWELVDHMLVEPGAPSGTPAANPADDKPAGRGRLRGRKG